MKSPGTRDAERTIAAVDAVLHRTAAHWTDPEILEWEAGQVGALRYGDDEDGVRVVYAEPGPTYGHDLVETVYTRPMVQLEDDHDSDCDCEIGGRLFLDGPFTRLASEYPPPEQTVHGPLLLGPEPDTVHPDPEPDSTATVTIRADIERYRPVAEEVAW